MTAEELNAITFIVGDTSNKQAVDDMPVPSFFDYVNDTDISFEEATIRAQAYCAFCDKPEVREVRRLSKKILAFSQAMPKLYDTMVSSMKDDCLDSIRTFLKDIVYYRVVNNDNDYFTISGSIIEDINKYELSHIKLYEEHTAKSPITYFFLYSDDNLWQVFSRDTLIKNAIALVSFLTSFVDLSERMIELSSKYPFGEIINSGRAILLGLTCDFDNDIIYIVVGEKGGKITYIASDHKSDINQIGSNTIRWQELTKSDLAVFGVNADPNDYNIKDDENEVTLDVSAMYEPVNAANAELNKDKPKAPVTDKTPEKTVAVQTEPVVNSKPKIDLSVMKKQPSEEAESTLEKYTQGVGSVASWHFDEDKTNQFLGVPGFVSGATNIEVPDDDSDVFGDGDDSEGTFL